MEAASKAAVEADSSLAEVSKVAWAVATAAECSSKEAEARSSSQT